MTMKELRYLVIMYEQRKKKKTKLKVWIAQIVA